MVADQALCGVGTLWDRAKAIAFPPYCGVEVIGVNTNLRSTESTALHSLNVPA